MDKFEVQEMLSDLDGGALLHQLSHAVHESAKSVCLHGDGKKTGEVTLKLTFRQISKGASQVMIGHKLTFKELTAAGDRTENRSNESPMHVTRTGVTSTPEGQLDFIEQRRAKQDERS